MSQNPADARQRGTAWEGSGKKSFARSDGSDRLRRNRGTTGGKGTPAMTRPDTGEIKMKRTVLISSLTALALAGTAWAAFAASDDMPRRADDRGDRPMMMPFEDIDADGDGKITAEEMQAHATLRFEEADTDKDGLLDAAEMQAQMLARATARMAERSARMIERMDRDGDGKLSAEEMRAGPREGDRFARMLSRLDEDGDGALSREEFEAARDMRGAHRQGDGHHRDGHPWGRKND